MINWVVGILIIIVFIAIVVIIRLKQDIQFYRIQQEELDEYALEVEAIYQQMRGIRHDYRNHLQVMEAYLQEAELEELQLYIHQLNNELNQVDTIIRTGNTLIDALVNTKLSRAKEQGVEIIATAIAPKELSISSHQLAIILGNLLNNAYEATTNSEAIKSGQTQFIRLYIAPIKNTLYISITNTMIKQPLSNFQSLKSPDRQGYGLRRIDQAVEANQGIVNRQWEEGVFATEVTLPLSQSIEASA